MIDLYHEGWLQVRRDFEELGKARWQQCWCIFRKGELVISLGQAVIFLFFLFSSFFFDSIFDL